MSDEKSTSNAAPTPAPPTTKATEPLMSAGASGPRQTEAERAKIKLEELLRPHVEKLKLAESADFQKTLDKAVKQLKDIRAPRAHTRHLLLNALLHIPADQSGAPVVRYFKSSDDWSKADIDAALKSLTKAIRNRQHEMAQLGVMLHGALIALVDAAAKQEGPDGSTGEKIDLIAALLGLHSVTFDPKRGPITGLAEPSVQRVLAQASSLLCRFEHRPDVRAVAGHRLFGFSQQFVLPTPSAIASQAEPAGLSDVAVERATPEPVDEQRQDEPRNESAQTPLSGTDTLQPKPGREEPLRSEMVLLRKQIDLARRESNSLRREREQERETSAELRRQLRMADDIRSTLSERVLELQAKLEVVLQLEAQLSAQAAENRAAKEEIDRLRESLKITESQARSAMDSEFERGRTVSRFTIAKFFVEPLRQISDSASTIEGDSGQFIRDMANSLRKYLEEGR